MVEALVSKYLTDKVLVSWHTLIRLGVLPSTFPAVAQVRKVESADGLQEKLMGDFPDVLSDFLSKDKRVKGDPMSICFKEGASLSVAGHRLPEQGEELQVVCEVGRPARVLPDPSRAGEPEVDCFSPVPGAVLLQGGPNGPQPQR